MIGRLERSGFIRVVNKRGRPRMSLVLRGFICLREALSERRSVSKFLKERTRAIGSEWFHPSEACLAQDTKGEGEG